MLSIKFKRPDKGHMFTPSNVSHYPNEGGIYIHGLKIKVGNYWKFIPLYVGITDNLQSRLFTDHYNNYKTGGSGNKELWDFSSNNFKIQDIQNKYLEMCYYDYTTKRSKSYRESLAYMNVLVNLKHLIYFQNENYFKIKSGQKTGNKINIDHMIAIGKYKSLAGNITKTKQKYDNYFYFVYAPYKDIDGIKCEKINSSSNKKKLAKDIEFATKKALSVIGIHTTARKEPTAKPIDIDIDLRDLHNLLINLGGHPYNHKGNYDPELVIKIRK